MKNTKEISFSNIQKQRNLMRINSNIKGITLIALIIMIIVLIILAGVTLNLTLGEKGIFKIAKNAKEENSKGEATDKINLKVLGIQMEKYAKENRMPTLQEVSDELCEDEEIEYVRLPKKQIASLNKINVGRHTSILTKLKEYPYEFEINASFQIASVDGKDINYPINNVYPANIKNIVDGDIVKTFSCTKEGQEYSIPESGYYKIECWGASGGNAGAAIGGKGAYTNGIIYLSKGEKIYVYVGEAGKNGTVSGSAMDGSFNGGGPCGGTNDYGTLSTGGGSTDIRLLGGEWDNFDSLKTRIMVASGGGGACRMNIGTWTNVNGGYGGTIKGGNGNKFISNRCKLYKSNWRDSNIRRAFSK